MRTSAVACAAAVVLGTGLLSAAQLRPAPAAPAVPVAAPSPTPSATPTPTPTPAPTAPPAAEPAAAPPPPAPDDGLGPPPGPEPELRPERVAAPADRYALLVGVQDYRSPTVDTTGSRRDVQLIRERLLAAGWPAQNVRVLVDDDASGAALREGMAWLADRTRPGAFGFFHYSGHVKQLGGGTEALWPVDRDFVRDTEVAAALGQVRGRLWVDVAGCEAGSFVPGLPSDRVLVTVSSSATQKSYEYPQWGTSVWTGLLFDPAVQQGQADLDRDGRVTVGEASRWARYYAQRVTLLQEPHGRQVPEVHGDPVRGWTLDAPPA